jgi:hypothetical protein
MMKTERVRAAATAFLLAAGQDELLDPDARGVTSVAVLADYADTGRYFTAALGEGWAARPDEVRLVTLEINRQLYARGHQDEVPAPVTRLTEPHASGFDRGFTHANARDGDVAEDDRPERPDQYDDEQWDAYLDGWIEGAGAYETYGGHGIGSRLADGRYYECEHRTL